MKVNSFFGQRMCDTLEFFFKNRNRIYSIADLMISFKLKPTDRQHLNYVVLTLYKMDILTRIKTSGELLRYPTRSQKNNFYLKNYYGLNLRNPLIKDFENVMTIIKNVN